MRDEDNETDHPLLRVSNLVLACALTMLVAYGLGWAVGKTLHGIATYDGEARG